MTSAIAALRAHAERLGREVYDHGPLGLGVEFADGNDAFWLLDDPVVTTADPNGDADELVALYDRLDRLRGEVIRVLRHHLAARDTLVRRSRTGLWHYSKGVSSSLDVGRRLTRMAEEAGDDADVRGVLDAWMQHQWIGKTPSPKRVERFLKEPLPPANERGFDDEDGDGNENGAQRSTIAHAVLMMGLCRLADAATETATPADLARAAEPRGRVGQMLLALHARLPDRKAVADFATPGRLTVTFADDIDDLPIRAKDRRLARRIKERGPEAVADKIADEFLKIDSLRRRMLAALYDVAHDRGMALARSGGMALLGVRPTWWLGRDAREIGFNPQRLLTAVARRYGDDPPRAVRRWLRHAPAEFASAVAERIVDLPEDATPVAPPERDLPPPPAESSTLAVELPALTAETVASADAAASLRIKAFWRRPELHKYFDRDYYDPPDAWATLDDWATAADRSDRWMTADAVLIYRAAGDARADNIGPPILDRFDPGDGNSDTEAEVAWIYRASDVSRAREWFAEPEFEETPHARVRAKHGDPVALRHEQFADRHEEFDADDLPGDASMPLRDRLRQWAATTHRWSGPDDANLVPAIAHGWTDVAKAMETNPHLLPGLLTIDRRADGFDEPGALLAGGLLLKWSRLDPSPFLARLILAIYDADLVALAREPAERSAVGRPEVRANVESSVTVYKNWRRDLELPLAIAWRRCRAAGAV